MSNGVYYTEEEWLATKDKSPQSSGLAEIIVQTPGQPDRNLGQAGDTATARIKTRIFYLDDERMRMFFHRFQELLRYADLTAGTFKVNVYSHSSLNDEEGTLERTITLNGGIKSFVDPEKDEDPIPANSYFSLEFFDESVSVNWLLTGFTVWGTIDGVSF